VTWRIESLSERAAWSARSSTSALRAFSMVSGRMRTSCGGCTPGARADNQRRTRCAASRGRGSDGRLAQTLLAQVRSVRVPGGLAPYHADAGAALAARHELLHFGVVESGGGDPAILGEHLREVAAVGAARLQRA